MNPAGERQRLDAELVRRGLFPTRSRARAAILAGQVFVNDRRADKAGQPVSAGDKIHVVSDPIPYASRGGIKLEHALRQFNLEVRGRIVIDIGASTGGFTDLLLKYGADHVYAVDVGYGQLAWHLRNDHRVTVMERTNARYLERQHFPRLPDLATIDVSFISVTKILPALARILADPGDVVALIKPQFEAGRRQVGKGGIVRDKDVHRQVMEACAAAAQEHGFNVQAMTYSPVPGATGNLEFFQWWSRGRDAAAVSADDIRSMASAAVSQGWEMVHRHSPA